MSIWLMAQVWGMELLPMEQSVLLVMCDHASDDGTRCYPSVRLIMWKLGRGRRAIQNAMKSLRGSGIITPIAHTKGGSSADGRGYATEYRIDLTKGVLKTPFEHLVAQRAHNDAVEVGASSEQATASSTTPRASLETGNGAPHDAPTTKESPTETLYEPSSETPEWLITLREIPGWEKKGQPHERNLDQWAERKGFTGDDLERSAIGLAKTKTKTLEGYSSLAAAFRDRLNKGYDRDVTLRVRPDPPAMKEPGAPIIRGDDGLWVKALEALSNQVTRPSFETWLVGSVGLGFTADGVLVVQVSTAFVAEMLERQMYSLIRQAVSKLNSDVELDVEFREIELENVPR